MATEEAEYQWEPIERDRIEPGMYVRGSDSGQVWWTPETVEGTVTAVSASADSINLDTEGREARELACRNWEQRLPIEQPAPELTPVVWDLVTPDALVVGDTVRVARILDPEVVIEGEVTALHCSMGSPGDGTVGRAVQLSIAGQRTCVHSDTWTFRKQVAPGADALPSAPATEDGRWERVLSSRDLRPGDRARGESRSSGQVREGVVASVTDVGHVVFNGQAAAAGNTRMWYRWVTTPVPVLGAWVSVEQHELNAGDRVRITHRRQGTIDEGVVQLVADYVTVQLNTGGREAFHRDYRTFERWTVPVEAPVVEGWVRVEDPTTLRSGERVRAMDYRATTVDDRIWREGVVDDVYADTFGSQYVRINGSGCDVRRPFFRWEAVPTPGGGEAPTASAQPTMIPVPQVGDIFNRTYTSGRAARFGARVTAVTEQTGGSWRVVYTHNGTAGYIIRVRADGTLDSTPPGTYVPVSRPAPAAADPSVEQPGTWVSVPSRELAEGDRIRYRRHTTDAWSSERVVTEVDGDGDVYVEGRSSYIHGGNQFERWTLPVVRTATGEAPLPAWATSLEDARRHVHATARRLWSGQGGENCSGGTSDFMEAAGLPDYRREYPAPPVVDESAQIREFLTLVRESAIRTAERHGKSMSTVHAWLRREGIVEPTPPPVTFTVTVTAPAGTTLDEVRRLGNIRDGWEVR
jgi:hypothetical protein